MITVGPVWLLFLLRVIELTTLLVVTIYWVNSMYKTLRAIPPVSRRTDPSMVWMIMVPFVGLIWQFVANAAVAESLAAEYRRRGWHLDENRPGFEQGVIACIVVCVVVLIRTSFAFQYSFSFVSTLLIGNLHPGFGFIGSIVIGFCMYRHMDRLAAFRERLEREPDPALSRANTFSFQQQILWNTGQYPPVNYPAPLPIILPRRSNGSLRALLVPEIRIRRRTIFLAGLRNPMIRHNRN
jgi:hypothetical protein